MDSIKLKEELLKLEKKLTKDGSGRAEEYRGLAERSDKTALEFKLKELAKHSQAIESQKKSDPEIIRLSEEKKEAEAPYREQTKGNKVLTRFIGLLLQELNGFEE